MNVGIDLGATNSVVAVRGHVKLIESYPPAIYLPDYDVSIIPTPGGDSKFPSVLCVDPRDSNSVLVGQEARQKVLQGEASIEFSRRSIGSDQTLTLGGGSLTAKQVTTHLLKYLRECTELALGGSVRSAVITYPAYFNANQLQETWEAAEEAGFDAKLQMITEPATAALAYTYNDERDPLRVMTYDLGSRTFDVAVLEKSQGSIAMKAFDGNHLLGGYDFDKAFIRWVFNQLQERGYTVSLNDDDPESRSRRAQLLHVAESVKIQLSGQSNEEAVPARIDFLVDDKGNKVAFEGQISRQQYEKLISGELDETIELCRRALGKAGMQKEELGAVLLVGGSTYGPWVQKAVNEAFGVEVERHYPEFCVAAGAAILAATVEIPSAPALLETNACEVVRSKMESELNSAPCQDLSGLRTKYEELNDKRQSDIVLIGDPEQRLKLIGPGGKLASRIENLFSERMPDRQELNRAIAELDRMINPPSAEMVPPMSQYHMLLQECHVILASKGVDPDLDSYRSGLNAIEKDANEAYATKSFKRWATANEALRSLHARIKKLHDEEMTGPPQELPPSPILKDYFMQEAYRMRAKLRAAHEEFAHVQHYAKTIRPRLNSIAQALDKSIAAIDGVSHDLDPMQSLAQLKIASARLMSLHRELDRLDLRVGNPLGEFRVATARGGTLEVPSAMVDRVQFSVTSPQSVLPGSAFVIDVWAHLDRQRQEVLERAREEAMGADVRIKSKGPVKVARGSTLSVSLRVDGLTVDPPEDTVLWDGEIGNATFALSVPASVEEGDKNGVVRIRLEGFEIARLNFIVQVGSRLASRKALPIQEQRHRTAFASYASEDTDAVLGRIQGMQKVLPSLNIFYAAAELRSGEHWQMRLKEEILKRDVMYLFWSEAASRSQWVEWEWRCGYRERGFDFIDPCPLVAPDEVPPPKELADHIHFSDWVLAYMRNAGKSTAPRKV